MNKGYFESPTDELRQVLIHKQKPFKDGVIVTRHCYKIQRKWLIQNPKEIDGICIREVWRDLPTVTEEEAGK